MWGGTVGVLRCGSVAESVGNGPPIRALIAIRWDALSAPDPGRDPGPY
jgi:hypothetical protein